MKFQLSKWYADCVTSDGDVFVGYSAQLQWKPVSLSYESALFHFGKQPTTTSTSFPAAAAPKLCVSGMKWNSRALDVNGTWTGTARPVSQTLYSSKEGEIVWCCHLPGANVGLAHSGRNMTGAGYVEHLTMSIPPWKLPITELRWGRFVGRDIAIVWIDWRGDARRSFAFRNGDHAEVTHVDDGHVALDGGTHIELDCGCVLRQGDLGSTVFKSVPMLSKVAPARMLATEECKWRSGALLCRPGHPDQYGWAIHEVVRWPST